MTGSATPETHEPIDRPHQVDLGCPTETPVDVEHPARLPPTTAPRRRAPRRRRERGRRPGGGHVNAR